MDIYPWQNLLSLLSMVAHVMCLISACIYYDISFYHAQVVFKIPHLVIMWLKMILTIPICHIKTKDFKE